MLLLGFTLISLISVPLARGRLRALGAISFERLELLLGALVAQVIVIEVAPGAWPPALATVHVLSYLAAGTFVVVNRRVPGMWLMGLGGGLNFLVIAANGGVMPASRAAVASAGISNPPGQFANSEVVVDPALGFIGDVFAAPLGPLANVFSPGDVCLALGIFVALHRICGSRLFSAGGGELSQLLREPGFARVWGAQVVSNLGDWMYALAVATSLVQRNGSAHALGFLLVAQVGPAAVTGLLGGPLVDRWPRKRVMVVADAVRALTVASLLFGGARSLTHIYLVAASLGIFEALFQPSLQASLPNLVSKERLVAANALVAGTFNLAVMAGPLLGGVLVAQLGLSPVLVINSLSFVISGVMIAGVAIPGGHEDHAPLDALTGLRKGLSYSISTPLVRGVFAVIGLVIFASALRAPVEPLFILRTLGEEPQALGFVGASWGLGMLLGSVAAPAAARRWRRERILACAIALVGTAVLAASLATALLVVAMLWVLSGVGNALGTVSYETLLLERTPDRYRGRVMSASEAVLNSAYLGGVALAGSIATSAGVRATYALSGVLLLGAAGVTRVLVPERAPRSLPAGAPGPPAAGVPSAVSPPAPSPLPIAVPGHVVPGGFAPAPAPPPAPAPAPPPGPESPAALAPASAHATPAPSRAASGRR